MNKEKGYNMTTRGEGWKKSDEVIEQIGKTLRRKYQEDAEYRKMRKKATQKGREAIQRLREEDPEFRARMRDKLIQGNKDPILRANRGKTLSRIMKEKFKDPKYRKRIATIIAESNRRRKKKIPDIRKFLQEIKSGVKMKPLQIKYRMSEDTVRARVKEILGKFGVNHYTDAKKFLQDKDIDEIMEEINK